MFYAIEYAYGSTVVNNGNRADSDRPIRQLSWKVYEFTRRALRDAWVAAGPPDTSASGYRATATARTPLVRKALTGAYDGDREAWRILAEQRVDGSPALAQFRAVIFDDWSESDHDKWVATAKEAEILSWARDTAAAQA